MTTLEQLDESARQERFDLLQQRMRSVWDVMRLDHEDESVVVVPSVAVDAKAAGSAGLVQAFEERFLFLLLLLRQPLLRMTYVTSTPIKDSIIEYYLALLPGVIPSHARARLTLVSVDDATLRPLNEKLLDRPRLVESIAAAIPNRERCHLIAYSTTERERDLALHLGIPMYGSDPRLADLGSKTGCRRLFAQEGVQHPFGAEDLHSREDVVDAILALLAARPTSRQVIVKLNEGASGSGNALVDLAGAASPAEVRDRVEALELESPTLSRAEYWERFAGGGVVEERVTGTELRSPSVQLRVLPDGTVELLSTHDQLLGGPSGQRYLGCTFPADPAYSRLISDPAQTIGRRLAREGVLGRFAVDFVVVRDETGAWEAHAIELNLRKGGTTHPFLTLQFLTDGRYDGPSGRYLTSTGAEKHLVATDHLEAPELRALRVGDLFDVVARHGLHFDQSRQTGVVFHMISCLTELGRVGLTAVGDTPEQAMELYERAQEVLLAEAVAAGRARTLPG
ncbi:peptide ligase PGM1-related protein [Cellulomonas sp. ICMP 17802]|uniref:peptide ligase PGM1-related protein n=1 Tax=Cellulomonas sp. ICMP 17802 TaxID=3239199 RepID=UPI00351BC783